MSQEPEYLLGTNDSEFARLEFQHSVWRDLTDAALERGGLRPGASVLDLGAGPGFVSRDIADWVGPSGRLTCLDESPVWHLELQKATWPCPVDFVQSRVEEADLPEGAYDLVFSRWVFSFLPELDSVAKKVLRALKPGGRVVIQDYNHEGISVFPRSPGFDAVVRCTREFYRGAGGNAWVAGHLPGALRRAGFERIALQPNVKAGGPESAVFRWADVFFPIFSGVFVGKGLMTIDERARFLDEWEALKADPDALFFSPIVCDVIAVKPG